MDMERVIGAALAGDQQAIAKLYNAYSHKVLGICYNIVGNRAVAEGDTVINGLTYKAMHKYHGGAINANNDTVPILT